MKSKNLGSTLVSVLMLTAILAVTIGVTLTIFSPAERTTNFWLSLSSIAFAESLMFCWPLYYSLRRANVREARFAFGLGQQMVFGIYLAGVIVLALVAIGGTKDYSLAVNFAPAQGIRLIDASAVAGKGDAATYNGNTRSRLALNRRIDAGASDVYQLDARFEIKPDLPDMLAKCHNLPDDEFGGVTAVLTISGSDSRSVIKKCVPARQGMLAPRNGPEEAEVTSVLGVDLAVEADLLEAPKGSDRYQISYTVRISNKGFASFRNLLVAHSIWLLMLVLALGSWRIGANYVSGIERNLKVQRQAFAEFQTDLEVFRDNVGMKATAEAWTGLVKRLDHIIEEARYATRESVPGSERFDAQLGAALMGLQSDFDSHAGSYNDQVGADLQKKADYIAVLIKQREAAVKNLR